MTRARHGQALRTSGFTLIEIAISLTVIAFLMIGGISMLRIQNERARFAETKAAMDEATQALLGFAASHGYLPCPASPTESDDTKFGTALPGCGSGANRGIVPSRDLSISGVDGWGQYLSYEVTYALTLPPITAGITNFALDTGGTLKLRTSSASGNPVVTDTATAFALWSHGPNGHYGISFQRVPQPASDQPGVIAANPDETANTPTPAPSIPPAARILVSHDEVSSPSNPEKNFDDRFVWMSRFILFRTISSAGYCIPHSGSTDTCNNSTSSSSSSSSSGSSSGAGSSSSGGSSTSSSGG